MRWLLRIQGPVMSPNAIDTDDNVLPLDDVLDLTGDERLAGFKWCDAVLTAVNQYLSMERRMTPMQTGTEVIRVLKGLPVAAQVKVSRTRINTETGEVDESRRTREFPAVVSTPDTAPPADYEHYTPPLPEPTHERDRMTDHETTVHSKLMIFIACALVGVTLILTVAAVQYSKETGNKAESSTLEVVIKVLGDIFTSTANTNPDSQQSSDSTDSSQMPSDDDTEDSGPRPSDDSTQPTYGP